MDKTLDRRAFVKGALVTGVAATVTAGAGDQRRRGGASVIVVEKAPEAEAGGNSRVSAQAVWTPSEIEATIRYFKEIATDYHLIDMPDAVVEAFINEAAKNAEWLIEQTGLDIAVVNSIEYPNAPSSDLARQSCMAMPKDGLGLSIIWDALMAKAQSTDITFQFEAPMTDLVFSPEGEAVGIITENFAVAANKGIVICSGGFENNEAMCANYLRYPALFWGTPYNTGDAHQICQRYDIDFWHMNSATPGTRIGLSMPGQEAKYDRISLDFEFTASTAFFWVDKYGQRFMNEKNEYMHGYGRDEIFYVDGMKMEWPRLPLWQVFDESSVAELTRNKRSGWLELVGDINISNALAAEIAAGVVFKADSPEGLAEQAGLDVSAFVAAFNEYNGFALAGDDPGFGRDAARMTALQSPPYYIAQVFPVMVNTNGGPRRNEQAQILRTDGSPVPRLFSAGEFGSVWAWFYQGGGNVSECLAFGRIAGCNAAALEKWMPS
ncbi:MAG: FAD-binding protein [Coriobacteriia bacterium]|nr:FAD-binding protein [Coriobacteriia bacterium]